MERKLAAIVAADIANYSLLIGENELGTLTELKKLHDEVFAPAISYYQGQLIRLMGDGSILAFESALNAVNFAINVQQTMAAYKNSASRDGSIQYRMGVNLGDIIYEKNDIHGEGINVAVRLEELASPGGICLSDSIYGQIRTGLRDDFRPIGQRCLKHISEPILVWRWTPPGASQDRSHTDATGVALHPHGRQILDPKVTSLLVDLHLRSAKLALSDAFDAMLAAPETGRDLSLQQIHEMIAEKLDEANELLLNVSVERCALTLNGPRKRRSSAQTMGDFLADAFDGGDMFHTMTVLQRIQTILRCHITAAQKRAALMQLTQDILGEKRAPEIKDSIRFAFVAP